MVDWRCGIPSKRISFVVVSRLRRLTPPNKPRNDSNIHQNHQLKVKDDSSKSTKSKSTLDTNSVKFQAPALTTPMSLQAVCCGEVNGLKKVNYADI